VVVLGISCNIDEAELVVVVLRVTRADDGTITHAVVMDHRTDPGEDHAKKLSSVQADLETVLRKQGDATLAVVRAMDHSPFKKGITNADEARIEAQGVVLGTVRRVIDRAVALNGAEIGKACKSDKASVIKNATQQFGEERQDSGMAALAGLAIASR
jgi:hypothetical protein